MTSKGSVDKIIFGASADVLLKSMDVKNGSIPVSNGMKGSDEMSSLTGTNVNSALESAVDKNVRQSQTVPDGTSVVNDSTSSARMSISLVNSLEGAIDIGKKWWTLVSSSSKSTTNGRDDDYVFDGQQVQGGTTNSLYLIWREQRCMERRVEDSAKRLKKAEEHEAKVLEKTVESKGDTGVGKSPSFLPPRDSNEKMVPSKFAVRFFGNNTERFLHRERERYLNDYLRNFGYGKQVFYHFDGGVIEKWLSGTVVSVDDLRKPNAYGESKGMEDSALPALLLNDSDGNKNEDSDHGNGKGDEASNYELDVMKHKITACRSDDIHRSPPVGVLIAQKMAKLHSLPIPAEYLERFCPESQRDCSKNGGRGKVEGITSLESQLWPTMRNFLSQIREAMQEQPMLGLKGSIVDEIKMWMGGNDVDDDLRVLQLYAEKVKSEVVIGHGDLQGANILRMKNESSADELRKNEILAKHEKSSSVSEVVDDDDVTFIDLEYSMLMERGFDIANHLNELGSLKCEWEFFPPLEIQKNFARHYLQALNRYDDSDAVNSLIAEMRPFLLVSHFFWALWSLCQIVYSKVEDFDYVKYAKQRFMALSLATFRSDDSPCFKIVENIARASSPKDIRM